LGGRDAENHDGDPKKIPHRFLLRFFPPPGCKTTRELEKMKMKFEKVAG
jgi:hypothetical protein